ncbi:hypothetical protein EGW08_012261, partial [Elysia chlorotica]
SAFYSPLGTSPYDLKESAEAWRTLAASQPGFPYDPMALYPYGPGKNATRENTNTLKAWLYEHRKNPYPTKGEKIMLAIITKMTLTQVSTWFANARRRLKKENKMTWSPRNRSEDGSDDVDNNEDDDDCGAAGEASRRRDAMTPTHDLDMASSKPSSPLLSPDSDHHHSHHRPPLKERIIRVDVDEDEDDDDDFDDDDTPRHLHGDSSIQEMETSADSLRSRHRLLSPHDDFRGTLGRPALSSSSISRDRSPLREDSSRRSHSSSQEHSDRRSPIFTGDPRKSPVTSQQRPGVASPTSSCASGSDARRSSPPAAGSPSLTSPSASSSTAPATSTPTTRPKIWSISDVINCTSSSSSSTSSSASTISSSSHHHHSPSAIVSSSAGLPSSLLSSPTSHPHARAMPSFLPPPSSPHQRAHHGAPHPQPGFFFLPPGAHWPPSAAAAAAAARFAGFGGAGYPLSLSHPTLSYPYGLGQPGSAAVAAAAVAATRAGLEAQAQAAHLAAAARAAAHAAEGGGAASRLAQREDSAHQPHGSTAFSRLEASRALFSPAREADGIRSQALLPPRAIVDSSI